MGSHKIQYGQTSITFELAFTQRKSLGITVYPDQRVMVRAPYGTPLAAIEKVVHAKGGWIVEKLQVFKAYPPASPPRNYVNGETHHYLGQRYSLQLIEDKNEGVRLGNGILFLHTRDNSDRQRIQKQLESWYRQRAHRIFRQRLAAVYPHAARLGIPLPELKIRKMKSRWGSCSSNGTITLNLKLIQMPEVLIDYVLLHELAHLKEHNHSKAYYRVLDALLPDWKIRREELRRFQIT